MTIKIGMHTDNLRSLSGSFEAGVDLGAKFRMPHVEFGVINGHYFINAMGYDPSVSLWDNPLRIRKYVESKGMYVSQIDGAYPMMGPDGAAYGIFYGRQAIRFAKELGAKKLDTTDSAALPKGLSKEEVFKMAVFNYGELLKWAEDYKIIINVEPHGACTTDVEFMQKLMRHFESEYLGVNMDTGNVFISGGDPVEFVKALRKYITHSHIKDVSASLAAASRGEETGIAVSEVSVGEGVNAPNIKKILEYLMSTKWDGEVSLECAGTEEKTRKSYEWLKSICG
jgi:sugar phosphate isomerase/epimerase